jgi:molecular chaperone HscB
MDTQPSYFALFGLPQSFVIDLPQLDTQFRRLQSEVHPDRFATAPDHERRLSLQMATQANEAYQTLKNPLSRARYLLQLKGIDTLEESNTSMPVDFLMQQMEWRESLEEAQAAGNVDALDGLLAELRTTEKALYHTLEQSIDHDVNDALATETVRKLKFIDKVQSEIEHAIETLE